MARKAEQLKKMAKLANFPSKGKKPSKDRRTEKGMKKR